jgi:hypothetical protein
MRGKHCLRVTSEKTYIFERVSRDELLEKGGRFATKDDISYLESWDVAMLNTWIKSQRKNTEFWRVIHSESELTKEHIRNDKKI